MIHRLTKVLAVFCFICSVLGIYTGNANAKPVVVNVAYENNPGEPIDIALKKWVELARERSNGQLELKLYPSSQLGAKKDIMEQMSMGLNVITIADAGFLADYVPDFGILVGPYLAPSKEKLYELVETDWYKGLGKQLEQKGLHLIASNWLYGTRHMVTKKPVRTPEDLQGMKIRVPNNRIQIAAIKAMGGTPTPMPLGEVYSALTQGVIDGAENPLSVLYGQKLHEPAQYLDMVGYLDMLIVWIGGQSFIETMPPDLVKIFEETGKEIGVFTHTLMAEKDNEILEKMKAEGVTVIEPDRDAFRKLAVDVYDQFPEWTPGLFEKIQSLMNE